MRIDLEATRFVGAIEVRNVNAQHTFSADELSSLLHIAGFEYDGSTLQLTAKDVEYLCLNVRFNFAKHAHKLGIPFDRSAFNHLYVVG